MEGVMEGESEGEMDIEMQGEGRGAGTGDEIMGWEARGNEGIWDECRSPIQFRT